MIKKEPETYERNLKKWQLIAGIEGPTHWQGYGQSLLSSTLNYTLAQVIAHGSVFTMSGGFREVATSVSWTALTGTKFGQNRRVSLYIFLF